MNATATASTPNLPLALNPSLLPISALQARARNPRTHSKRQIRQIADSIRTFGFTNPVLLDRDNGIVAGHGRVEAARLLGWTQVPTLRLEHLTPDQIRAYVIADNRLAEKAGWDKAILAIELEHLLSLDAELDVTVTGFAIAEIDLLIEEVAGPSPDPTPEPPVPDGPPICQPGDLWVLGRHRLLCASALERGSYEALLADRRAKAVFTDPPYNVPIAGHVGGLGRIQHAEFAMASGEMSDGEFYSFLSRVLGQLAAFSVPGSLHYLCMDWRHIETLLSVGRAHYDELKNLCVWVKDNAGMGSMYRSQHELVAVFKHGTAPHLNNVQLGQYGRHRSNVWKYAGVNTFARVSDEGCLAELHPTVKPVDLVADALLDCTARGDLVLDAFMGSGTTLIAAERIGRACAGLEIEPLYVDRTIRRWQRHSGDQAVNARTGQTFDAKVQQEARHG